MSIRQIFTRPWFASLHLIVQMSTLGSCEAGRKMAVGLSRFLGERRVLSSSWVPLNPHPGSGVTEPRRHEQVEAQLQPQCSCGHRDEVLTSLALA